MNPLVRPQPRLAAALIAAGVVTASSVVTVPVHREIPTLTADVAYASAVTDALVDFGQGVEVANALVGIHVDAVISLPFEATLALMAAAQHPELSPNILSFLVQRFVNPAVGDPIHAYPYDTELAVSRLAELLPYPLGPSATEPGLINEGGRIFAAVFNSVLGQLPDPIPGYEAVQSVMNDTVLGGVVVAAHLLARAPMNMVWNTANYLGYLPANLEATFESALASPDQIPGLVSNLAYGLLSPDPQVGLFGKLLDNVADPLTWLPAPVGYTSGTSTGLANLTRDGIADAMNTFLSALPDPVAPSALPPGTGPVLGPRGGLSNAKGDESVGDATVSTLLSDDVAEAPEESVETSKVVAEPTSSEADPVKSEPNEAAPEKAAPEKDAPRKTEPKKDRPLKKVVDKVTQGISDALKFTPKKVRPGTSEPSTSEASDQSSDASKSDAGKSDAGKKDSTGDAA